MFLLTFAHKLFQAVICYICQIRIYLVECNLRNNRAKVYMQKCIILKVKKLTNDVYVYTHSFAAGRNKNSLEKLALPDNNQKWL